MMDSTPVSAQLIGSYLVPKSSSDLSTNSVLGATGDNGRPSDGLSQTTVTLGSQLPFGVPSSPTELTVPRVDALPLSGRDSWTTQRKILETNVPLLSTDREITRTDGTVLLPQLNPGTLQNMGLSKAQKLSLRPNRVAAHTESFLFPFGNLPSEPGQRGLSTALRISPAGDGNSSGTRVDIIKTTSRQFRGLQPILTGEYSVPESAGAPTPIFEASMSAASKLTNGINYHKDSARSANENKTAALAEWGLSLRKQDFEIFVSTIRSPPRYSLRRQVERIAQVLALTAFHGFSPLTNSMVPGDFLKRFTGLSRNYRYASTLAFTYLTQIEFPGKRTERWFEANRIDEKVADVRSWYWHRVFGRARVIERFQTSWVERVWRFLILAAAPVIRSSPTNVGPDSFGLWFGGVSRCLLADPDLEGQFETAIRFWIRRFYVWVTRSGGGYPQLLRDLREEMVQEIQPLDGKTNRELWRLETRCGGVYFIIGMTGEVVGWVDTVSNGLMSVRQKRAETRMNTIFRTKITARTADDTFPTGSLQANGKNQGDTGNTWQDLRGDWREHASALLSPSVPSHGTESLTKGLIGYVYRPDSKTVSHGIHESVKLPHHRLLAERWILAQVEPGGVSGKPVLNVGGHTRRKEKVMLDLQAKMTVESVRCSGEKWCSSMEGVLAQGLGFIQTPGMGWFVLEETGQVSPCE